MEEDVTRTAGVVFDIKKFAIHDGPGIRTTVFAKDCPLRCLWCHNPHSQNKRREIAFQESLCIRCGQCAATCPHGAHEVSEERHLYNRQVCVECGDCITDCLPEALGFVGATMTVAEVMAEVLKDRKYYETSGGGVTLSGGEPMMQFNFSRALLQTARDEGLHTVLDSCRYAAFERYAEIMPLVNPLHYDIKETNPHRHREYTGVDNERILENLHRIDELGTPIILRCPIIPGLNDRDDHLETLGPLAAQCRNVTAIHILPFHPYGSSHADKLGLAFQLRSLDAATEQQAEQWITQVAAHAMVPVTKS